MRSAKTKSPCAPRPLAANSIWWCRERTSRAPAKSSAKSRRASRPNNLPAKAAWPGRSGLRADLRPRRFRWAQFAGAVRTIAVRFRDFPPALRAAGMQIAFAVWAEVEARPHARAAPRAGIRERLSHEKINDESDEAVGRQQNDAQQRPKRRIHAASLGVA